MKPTAESRSCRSQARCTGVCPEGAQVRRRTGWSMKPLSSKKTMGLPRLAAPFLSAANPAFAILPRPYRLLPWHAVRASGMSSPSRGVSSRHDPSDTLREIAWPPLRPRDDRSKGRFGIQLSLARPREFSTVVASASRSDGACDQDVVWQLTPRGLLSPQPDATVVLTIAKHQRFPLLRRCRCFPATTAPRAFDELAVRLRFLSVS